MRLLTEKQPDGWISPEDYIRQRGYVSYSSLKNLRDGNYYDPNAKAQTYHDVGTEVHARFLENRIIKTFDADMENLIGSMLEQLNKDRLVRSLVQSKYFKPESEFRTKLNGVPVVGYIDIDCSPEALGDLKTMHHDNLKKFIKSMDFLQPALYRAVRKVRPFYFIGIPKIQGVSVRTFSVSEYPNEMDEADKQLNNLLDYVRKEILKG